MKRNIVIAAVTAAALIGGGTATALATTGDDDGGAAPRADVSVSDDGGVRGEDDARDDDAARAASAKVTAADAVTAALADTPGTAVSAELDDEDDDADDDADDDGDDRRERAAWEVEVLSGDGTWHSVRVDPATGKVLGSEKDDEDDTAEVRAALKGTSVDAARAAKATAAAGHGTVTSVELDEDGHYGDGKPAWEVETHASGKGEQEWRVDPKTGKVTADRSHESRHSHDSHSDDSDDD